MMDFDDAVVAAAEEIVEAVADECYRLCGTAGKCPGAAPEVEAAIRKHLTPFFRWIPCGERLPSRGDGDGCSERVPVLIDIGDGHLSRGMSAYYRGGYWQLRANVVFWAELPPPPENERSKPDGD